MNPLNSTGRFTLMLFEHQKKDTENLLTENIQKRHKACLIPGLSIYLRTYQPTGVCSKHHLGRFYLAAKQER